MVRLLYLLVAFMPLISRTGSHESAGMTIELPDNEQVCFYEDFEGSRTYIFDYRVIRGGNFDIDARIESPTGNAVYSEVRRQMDTVAFQISWGTYKFCFSNEFSTISHKVVYFEVRPEDHKQLALEGGRKSFTANTQLEESMEGIHGHSTRIMKYQQRYRLNEARGRAEADQLNYHVQLWSLVQALIILVVGLGELFILRRFFTEKSTTTSSISLDGKTEVVHAVPAIRP